MSLTVLQGERGAVHRLALGRSSGLRVGGGAAVVNAASEAGAQLQAPHVANHGRRIKGLLRRRGRKQTNGKTQRRTPRRRRLVLLILCFSCVWWGSPSICFWQSFSASVGWLIHVCSCGVQCLQRSWKLMSHLWDHENHTSHMQTQHYSNALAIILVPFSHLLRSSAFILLKHLRLARGISFCHIHHNNSVWNLANESHFSTLWYLLPPSQTTYLYHNNHLPRTQKAHYWLTNLFILATSARDSSPDQLVLVSSGSELGKHPNCSLKLPHSWRILQDTSR